MRYFSADGTAFRYRARPFRVCEMVASWNEPLEDPQAVVEALRKVRPKLHVFSFFQRVPHTEPRFSYPMEPYGVAVIELRSFEDWWTNGIGKKTRRMVSKAERDGVKVRRVDFDDELVKGISAIYNEAPVRQGRKFPHYNDSLEKVRRENGTYPDRSVYFGAFHEGKLIGFARIVFEAEFVDVMQLLSLHSHGAKGVTNALLASIVRLCSERGVGYIAYGEWGSGGLAEFKQRNGFTRMEVPRYYVPLNAGGRIALALGLHRSTWGFLPARVTAFLRSLRTKWYARRADSGYRSSGLLGEAGRRG